MWEFFRKYNTSFRPQLSITCHVKIRISWWYLNYNLCSSINYTCTMRDAIMKISLVGFKGMYIERSRKTRQGRRWLGYREPSIKKERKILELLLTKPNVCTEQKSVHSDADKVSWLSYYTFPFLPNSHAHSYTSTKTWEIFSISSNDASSLPLFVTNEIHGEFLPSSLVTFDTVT